MSTHPSNLNNFTRHGADEDLPSKSLKSLELIQVSFFCNFDFEPVTCVIIIYL